MNFFSRTLELRAQQLSVTTSTGIDRTLVVKPTKIDYFYFCLLWNAHSKRELLCTLYDGKVIVLQHKKGSCYSSARELTTDFKLIKTKCSPQDGIPKSVLQCSAAICNLSFNISVHHCVMTDRLADPNLLEAEDPNRRPRLLEYEQLKNSCGVLVTFLYVEIMGWLSSCGTIQVTVYLACTTATELSSNCLLRCCVAKYILHFTQARQMLIFQTWQSSIKFLT